MKNNLLKSFELQLEYLLKLHKQIKHIGYINNGMQIEVTVKPVNNTFSDLDMIHNIINDNLCTYTKIVDGNLLIVIF